MKFWSKKHKQFIFGCAYFADGKVFSVSQMTLVDNITNDVVVSAKSGKKSVSGQEIYENDIIKFGNSMDELFVITKFDGAFYAVSNSGKTIEQKTKVAPYLWEDRTFQGVEIVGNIFEDSYLLS
jgi:uncharacterized phage protein (TIGR01671 family)